MKKYIYLLITIISFSCTTPAQQTPEEFVASIESIAKEFNKVGADKIASEISNPVGDFELTKKEINKIVKSAKGSLSKLTEINKDFPIKKELKNLVNSLDNLINDDELALMFKKAKKSLSDDAELEFSEQLNQNIEELDQSMEIMKKLIPKIMVMLTESERYEKTLVGYYEHYKLTPKQPE